MRKVITRAPRFSAILVIITIMLMAPLAYSYEVMSEAYSKSFVKGEGVQVVGGKFVALESGREGWQAQTDTEANPGAGEPNYIQYSSAGIKDLTEGTIEFWIQRNREGGMYYGFENPETYDTVFELLQPDNYTAFSLMVMWDYEANVNESAFLFNYFDWTSSNDRKPVWGETVPIGFKAAVGDWVHIALTFGENVEDNKIIVNGVEINNRYEGEVEKFSKYLQRSDRMRIGIETGPNDFYPGGTSMLYRSVLSSFEVHDEIITHFDLENFAFDGAPKNLKAEFVNSQVQLSWMNAVSQNVEGYNVYKRIANNGSYEKINSDLVVGASFVDANVQEGKSYNYVLKGVNREEAESNASNMASITIVSGFYRVTETSKAYDPQNLSGIFKDNGIVISWSAPAGFAPRGYNVYRRAGEGSERFTKLNNVPVRTTTFTDLDITAGATYYYSVTSLNDAGQEGRYPSEIRVVAATVAIGSISVDPARAVRSGEEITVTVRGTAGGQASVSIAGLANDAPMTETGSGVYFASITAGNSSLTNSAVTATLNGATQTADATVTVDNDPPSAIIGLDIRNDWENEINLDWQPATDSDFKEYNVYRSNEDLAGQTGVTPYKVIRDINASELWDNNVTPNMTFYYAVAGVDHAGNVGPISNIVSARVLADTSLPVVSRIEDNTAGVTLRDGDTLEVYVEGESGCRATFSVGGAIVDIALNEDSRIGRYTGSYVIASADIVNDFIIVKMTDRSDNTSTFASDDKVNIDGSTKTDSTPPNVDRISENSWSIAGFSGKLVAGDMLTVELAGEASGVAYFNIEGVTQRVRMNEVDGNPGIYIGTYTIKDGDYAENTSVTGYLADASGNISSITASSNFNVDTTIKIEVTPSQNVVPADQRTRVDITAKATNLNGDAVTGHTIKFTLTTTDEYTGIVGSGRYTEYQDIVGGNLRVQWHGETDAFGEVEATFKSGFAAKTTIILAKDLNSGDVGVGYVTSYVSASVDITLIPERTSRRLRTIGRGAYIQLTATPDKLTADGESTSRIRAKITDVRGQPVADERIVFSMSSDNGHLVALNQDTDNRGLAEAEYTAGTKMGTVVITALDTRAGISASVMIVLMSDAPANIYLSASPMSLPADSRSSSEISVNVSDINNNPNQGAVIEYNIVRGAGRIDVDLNETDRNGDARNLYRAGGIAGTVTIEAKVTSRIPSEPERNRAKGTIFVGELYEGFDDGVVTEWLKKVGDEIERGEVIAKIRTDRGEFNITAKNSGKLHAIKKYERDDFEIGDTLGIIEIIE